VKIMKVALRRPAPPGGGLEGQVDVEKTASNQASK
jgi:hypothetical protein